MQPSNRKKLIGRLIAFSISIASLVWIARAFDLEGLWDALREANYWFLIPVAALISLAFWARAIRWGTLFAVSPAPRWKELFGALMVGYLANNVLPARAGDLVRAYSLGKGGNIPKSTVLATVVVERIFDMVITLILLGVAFLFFPLPDWSRNVGIVLLLLSLAAIGFLMVLNLAGLKLINSITRLLRFLPQSLLERIETIGEGFIRGVEPLRDGQRVLRFLAPSVLIWALEVAITYVMARAFNLSLGVADSLFVLLIIAIGMAIPSAPGSIGTFEFFGVSALALLGYSGGEALGFLLALHAVTLLGSSIIGAYCLTFQPSGRNPVMDIDKMEAG